MERKYDPSEVTRARLEADAIFLARKRLIPHADRVKWANESKEDMDAICPVCGNRFGEHYLSRFAQTDVFWCCYWGELPYESE